MRRRTIILYNILFLCFIYFSIAFIFSTAYMALDYFGLGEIVDHYSSYIHQQQHIDLFTRSFYFSITTLFSVGYGDMSAFGLSKGLAIIESMLGYVLPYVMLLNYVLFKPTYRTK